MDEPRLQDRPLGEADLDPDPLVQFRRWLDEVRAHGAFEPEAMALATASAEGAPSARMVLMKGSTSAGSPSSPTTRAARPPSSRRTHARRCCSTGRSWAARCGSRAPVARVSREETEAYARARSRESRLSALASPQSRPVESREWLEERVAELEREQRPRRSTRRRGLGRLPAGSRERGSSGSTARTACTTASASSRTAAEAGGRRNDWARKTGRIPSARAVGSETNRPPISCSTLIVA